MDANAKEEEDPIVSKQVMSLQANNEDSTYLI